MLVSVLVAAGIGSVVMLAMSKMTATGFRAQKHIELKDEIQSLKRNIQLTMDCGRTLAAVNKISGSDCDPSAAGAKFLLLKDFRDGPMTKPLETDANVFKDTGEAAGWYLRTQCDRIRNTLIVKAARRAATDKFARDPLSNRDYDWTDANDLELFGPDNKICQRELGGAGGGPVGFARYKASAGQNLGMGSTSGAYPFDTLVEDAANNFNPATHVFTATEAGLYSISTSICLTANVIVIGAWCRVNIIANGTAIANNVLAAISGACEPSVSGVVNLAVGDTVVIQYGFTNAGYHPAAPTVFVPNAISATCDTGNGVTITKLR